MKGILRKIFFEEAAISEYVTITLNEKARERVYLETKNCMLDISQTHWVLSLVPVVFGIWVEKKADIIALEQELTYTIYFKDSEAGNKKTEPCILAAVALDFLDKIEEKNGTFFLLKQVKSSIYHVHFVKLWMLFFRYYKKPELSFNKFKSIVAAFSYPRKVRLVSFGQGKDYNIFPMDFAGEIVSCNRFVFGLRHTNRTLQKIIETKKIVVSEIPFKYKEAIYQLGRHHLSNPPSPDSLPFEVFKSEIFGFYIPAWANSYNEIKITKAMNVGSHMLLWGESVNEKEVQASSGHLFHIHFLLYLHQKRKGFGYLPA